MYRHLTQTTDSSLEQQYEQDSRLCAVEMPSSPTVTTDDCDSGCHGSEMLRRSHPITYHHLQHCISRGSATLEVQTHVTYTIDMLEARHVSHRRTDLGSRTDVCGCVPAPRSIFSRVIDHIHSRIHQVLCVDGLVHHRCEAQLIRAN